MSFNFNINDDIKNLPFITCVNDLIVIKEKLGIQTIFQLVGKVLSFKKSEQTNIELYEEVCEYFKEILDYKEFVLCIFTKLDTIIPGFCDLDFDPLEKFTKPAKKEQFY